MYTSVSCCLRAYTQWLRAIPLLALFFTNHVSAAEERKTFLEPRIAGRDGRMLRMDRCVNSYRFPERCSQAATQEAARQICAFYGYTGVAQWQWRTEQQQIAWIWTESWINGEMRSGFNLIQGTGLFTAVECLRQSSTTDPLDLSGLRF